MAERALARHCDALLPKGPRSAGLLDGFAALSARFARTLPAALAPLCGGECPGVEAGAPEECTFAMLAKAQAGLVAHCLLALGTPDRPALASIDGSGVLALLDRAYGGRGEAPVPLPGAFPLSGRLLLERIEAALAAALGEALATGDEITPLGHHSDLSELASFSPDTALARAEFTVTPSGQAAFGLRLALPQSALGGSPRRSAVTMRTADPAAAPFAELSLPLTAVLVDMAMPVGRISALRPGQVLPVTVPRAVPLRIGQRTVAHGAVGSEDDRIAIQITHLA